MANMEINGRTFRDIESYNAAKRDQLNIERIKNRIDLTNIEDVKRLKDNIECGRYRFESMLGEDFIDELEDILKELEAANNSIDSRRNSRTRVKTKESKGEKVKADKKEVRSDTKDKNRKVTSNSSQSRLSEMDEEMKAEVLRVIRQDEKKRKLWVGVLSLILVASLGYLAFYYALYGKNDAEYKELAELKKDTTAKNEISINYTPQADKPPILKKYETLYQKNQKLVGWLTVGGTVIDYPVMQTNNNDYYLEHNYNQDYDKNGSIFMDYQCDPAFPNDNMIIYGHNMKSGKMFGSLKKYASQDFYKEHPQIYFDTIYEEGTYDVMYVFRSRIYSEEEIVFKYYQFIDATSADEFYSNMDEMKKISLYDTGIEAQYGDKLITLSTCDSSETNGRFVVVAKKVR